MRRAPPAPCGRVEPCTPSPSNDPAIFPPPSPRVPRPAATTRPLNTSPAAPTWCSSCRRTCAGPSGWSASRASSTTASTSDRRGSGSALPPPWRRPQPIRPWSSGSPPSPRRFCTRRARRCATRRPWAATSCSAPAAPTSAMPATPPATSARPAPAAPPSAARTAGMPRSARASIASPPTPRTLRWRSSPSMRPSRCVGQTDDARCR